MTLKRRRFLSLSAAALGGLAAARTGAALSTPAISTAGPLKAPEKGKIKVAFAINHNANVMDLAGPWEVFQDVHVPGRGSSHDDMMPFKLFTVAPQKDSLRATGGLHLIPDYSVDDAPAPDLVVVGAQRGDPRMLEWLKSAHARTHLTMSVCTGAFQLGHAGLLDGLAATTHHDFYDSFAESFPNVELQRGLRFVESGRIATAGGLTSGIDLALRVVERYFGRPVAERTAVYMEYVSERWKVA